VAGVGDFTAVSICRERSFPDRFAKKVFNGGYFLTDGRRYVCVFKNQSASIGQLDFGCLPCRAYSFATFIDGVSPEWR